MSVASEITRITTDRNTIRNKLVNLGLAQSADTLDDLADAVDGIANRGAPTAEVKEGESYTIQPGYYSGGSVAGVAGGGSYNLQAKTVTPTKQQQAVSPDAGYYGLSGVAVEPIPSNYNDTSAVTATAGDVLANKTIVNAAGQNVAGTMPNNGAVSKTLDTTEDNQSYTVPAGYHNGSGAVSIVLEEKTATPTESAQSITPTTGKVLSKVTVDPIPDNYGDTTGTDAAAGDLLVGKKALVDDDGSAVEITGTMPNNGTVSKTLDATTGNQSFTIAAGKHSGSGAVNIVLEEKSATPTTSAQNVTPTAGKVLSKVTVAAIPAIYGDATNADAAAANILAGKKAVVKVNNAASLVTGSMTNNGAISGSIDGLTTTSYTVPAGYTSGGSVSLTNDIETSLAAI